jgi:hypothetical protein
MREQAASTLLSPKRLIASRDQEDVAGLFKHLSFSGVKLFTIAEGEIAELQVGFKGTMNALFLKDLRQKSTVVLKDESAKVDRVVGSAMAINSMCAENSSAVDAESMKVKPLLSDVFLKPLRRESRPERSQRN